VFDSENEHNEDDTTVVSNKKRSGQNLSSVSSNKKAYIPQSSFVYIINHRDSNDKAVGVPIVAGQLVTTDPVLIEGEATTTLKGQCVFCFILFHYGKSVFYTHLPSVFCSLFRVLRSNRNRQNERVRKGRRGL
jgi:hypothetical protein